MNILVVEDEKNLATVICQMLKEEKWQTTAVYDGNDGADYALSGLYDCIIMDVMLPHKNGFEIVQEMRENKIETPVLMLSALDEVPDKVKGLNVGADDYMTKPFDRTELIARIRAMTRRKGEVVINDLDFADLTLELSTCELYCHEKHIHLSYKEFEIMKLLMEHPEMITTKEDLIVQVWGMDSEAIDNNVEVYISFLRKKLKFLKSKVTIKAIRRVGYRFEVSE
ncbi:response regulator transcription factor [Catenisphaera adipataccumulans]|jgi:DNA-binding response OmpR family regulator|uniref:DNA-binding response OmpR family regulator n=1 Tax=Catenisphaera adipataccumulans TaxID=700500 RepID=A0A7W8CY34_9FIRM|nr:response regulator transcription factor [Catenisphaera adipataccumulans]MBB5182387.1 DNA-binding response OmpR family regulator [Catenisphaera adipataccumulans]